MILHNLEEVVTKYHSETQGLLPRYDGHSLFNIPHLVKEILTGVSDRDSLGSEHFDEVDLYGNNKIVLFYVDGISYDFFSRLRDDQGFFGKISRKGAVSPVTAVFPSTTAASCTTLNTGLAPIEHHLLEWQLYFHETGALIYTLPFRAVTGRYSRRIRELSPSRLFQGKTIYEEMKREGVRSFVLVNRTISRGSYSDLIFDGATIVPYSYITDCVIQLRKILEREPGPLYVYVYIESADAVGHIYGPDSEIYGAEVSSISRILKYELLDKIDPVTANDVGILLTSDHGQVNIDPRGTFYLNKIAGLWDTFEKHMGDTIPPVGSPRDVFLHVDSDREDEVLGMLSDALEGKARNISVGTAVRDGIFGPGSITRTFRMRSGNILVLPEPGETVWYKLKGQAPMHLKGLHGGMTRTEMLVPFCAGKLSKLL